MNLFTKAKNIVDRQTIGRLLLYGLLLRVALMFVTFHGDLLSNMDWGIRFFEYGPKYFYRANVWSFLWPNQPPGNIYVFALLRFIYEQVFAALWWINVNIQLFPSNVMLWYESSFYSGWVKLPGILGDLGIAYLIYRFLEHYKKGKLALWGAALYLFNPPIFYNSSFWGQTDSTMTFLILLSFWFLLVKKNPVFATLSFILSLYFKVTLVILAPVFLVAFLKQNFGTREVLASAVVPLLVVALLTLPFVDKGNVVEWIYYIYKDKILGQQQHLITANAFNLWALFYNIDFRLDSTPLLGKTVFFWGNVLFGAVLFGLLARLWKRADFEYTMQSAALAVLAAFLLLANMHERYLFAFFPFFVLAGVGRTGFEVVYAALSGIHLLNLYNLWWQPRIEQLVTLMSWKKNLLPRALSVGNLILGYLVFRRFWQGKDLSLKLEKRNA